MCPERAWGLCTLSHITLCLVSGLISVNVTTIIIYMMPTWQHFSRIYYAITNYFLFFVKSNKHFWHPKDNILKFSKQAYTHHQINIMSHVASCFISWHEAILIKGSRHNKPPGTINMYALLALSLSQGPKSVYFLLITWSLAIDMRSSRYVECNSVLLLKRKIFGIKKVQKHVIR